MPPPLIPQPMPMPMPMPALRTRANVDPDPDADDPTADNLVNMYFLILGAFVILVMCSFWYWRRNKRSKALASLGVRRTALVADLELRRRRDNRGGGGGGDGGGMGIGGGDGDGDGEAPPPYVQRPERARGGLPKYEEVVEGGATEEEVERVRRSVERGTTTGVEGEGQERQQQQQQQGTAEGEDETVRERTGGGGGLVPGDRGGTETERAGSTSTPTPI